MGTTDVSENVLAPCMFYLSLAFVALIAAVLVLCIDVRRVGEAELPLDGASEMAGLAESTTLSVEELAFEDRAFFVGELCASLLLLIWPLFIAEQLVISLRPNQEKSFVARQPYWWLFCVLPPLRLCGPSAVSGQVWLPRLGWQVVDRKLQRMLEHAFSIPMIWIALLILPVLGLEFFFKQEIIEYPALRLSLHIGTGLIWFAFAVEFIVMVSVADSKLSYCKKHWLDLAIILLPLISFLRSLRLLRATKVVKIGKLQQLSRLVRVYRMRGVAMRGLKALMLLEVLHRLLRTKPEKRLKQLERMYIEKQHELNELAEAIERFKRTIVDER